MFSKLKSQLSPFGLLGVGLVVVTLLTALSGMWQYQYEVAHQSPKSVAIGKYDKASLANQNVKAALGEDSNRNSQSAQPTGGASHSSNQTAPPKAASQNTAATPAAPAVDNQPAPAAAPPATVSLTLSVNGHTKGSVQLKAGSNQCDVLTQALADGLISSLDMRSSPGLGTAVYVIDGVGDPGSVWWIYKVNGTEPKQGCALITAHNGDVASWQYLKN